MKKVQDFLRLAEEKEQNVVTLILNEWGGFFTRIFVLDPSKSWIGYIQDYQNNREIQTEVQRLSSKALYIQLSDKQQPQEQPQEKPQEKPQPTSQIKVKSFEELAKHFSLDLLDNEEEKVYENDHLISNVYFNEFINFYKKEITGIKLKFHRQKAYNAATTEIVTELYALDYESGSWKPSRIYCSLEFIKDWIKMTDEEIEEVIEKRKQKQKEVSRKFAEEMYKEYLEKGMISEEDFEKVLKAYEEYPEIFIEEVKTEAYHETSQILESEIEEKKMEKEKQMYQEQMEEIWQEYINEVEEIEQEIENLKQELSERTKNINIEEIPEEFREDAKSILKGITNSYETKIKQLEKRRRRLLKEYSILKELYREALRYYYMDEEEANSLKEIAIRTIQKLK